MRGRKRKKETERDKEEWRERVKMRDKEMGERKRREKEGQWERRESKIDSHREEKRYIHNRLPFYAAIIGDRLWRIVNYLYSFEGVAMNIAMAIIFLSIVNRMRLLFAGSSFAGSSKAHVCNLLFS